MFSFSVFVSLSFSVRPVWPADVAHPFGLSRRAGYSRRVPLPRPGVSSQIKPLLLKGDAFAFEDGFVGFDNGDGGFVARLPAGGVLAKPAQPRKVLAQRLGVGPVERRAEVFDSG